MNTLEFLKDFCLVLGTIGIFIAWAGFNALKELWSFKPINVDDLNPYNRRPVIQILQLLLNKCKTCEKLKIDVNMYTNLYILTKERVITKTEERNTWIYLDTAHKASRDRDHIKWLKHHITKIKQ